MTRPCSAAEALERAQLYIGKARYLLSAGGYKLAEPDAPPWRRTFDDKTQKWIETALDCSGFCSWLYRLPRTRPGFNKGHWSHVSSAINTDSIVEDAEHLRELFTVVDTPAPGDLLVYPGRWINGVRVAIGHIGVIESVPAEWDAAAPQYQLLTVIHCSPSSAARKWSTGIKRTDGGIWRDRQGKARTRIVRVVP